MCYSWLYEHSLSLCPCPSSEAVAASTCGDSNTFTTLSQCLLIVWLHHNFQGAPLKRLFFLPSTYSPASIPPVNSNLLPAWGGKTHCQVPTGSQHSPAGSTTARGSRHEETPEWQGGSTAQELSAIWTCYLCFLHSNYSVSLCLTQQQDKPSAQAWGKKPQTQPTLAANAVELQSDPLFLLNQYVPDYWGKMQVTPGC